MPPDKFRPPAGNRRAQAKQPGVGLLAASLSPAKQAAQARLLAEIERLLGGPIRCHECGRPLTSLRSIQLGWGPVCRARRFGGGS